MYTNLITINKYLIFTFNNAKMINSIQGKEYP